MRCLPSANQSFVCLVSLSFIHTNTRKKYQYIFHHTFPEVLSHSLPVPSALAPLPLHAKSANCMPTRTSPRADARKTGSWARYW